MQKLGGSISAPLAKIMGNAPLPVHPRFVITDLCGRKNKRTELDDRRLALCHTKVGGEQKH